MSERRPVTDWVGVIIAGGLVLAFNIFCFAVLYDAIASKGPGLSDNATQVLTGLGGGMIGILGGIVGYRVGSDGSSLAVPPRWPGEDEDTKVLPPG